MMMFPKIKPVRSEKYRKWVKSLPSVVSGKPADDPHHLIGYGYGGMGTKAPDIFTFPLTRLEHTELHNVGWREWEEVHGLQWTYVARTLELAVAEGLIVVKGA